MDRPIVPFQPERERDEEALTRRALLHMLEDLRREHLLVRETRHQWVDTVDSIRDPIMVHDSAGRVIRANRAYAALAGLGFPELLGRNYWDCFPRRNGPLRNCANAACTADHPVEEITLGNGEIYTSRVFRLRDDGSHMPRALHLFKNVTQEKKVEAEIRSLARFPEENPSAVMRLSRDGDVLYGNPASAALQQVCQASLGQRVNKEWIAIVRDSLAGAVTKEFDLENGDRIFAITINPVSGEGYVNLYATDITERKRQARALAAGEARYHAMVDQAAVAILQSSLDGTILTVNQAFCAMLGYPESELVGRTFNEFTHPEDRSESAALRESLLSSEGLSYRTIEKRYIHKYGGTIWASLTQSVVRSTQGKPDYFVTIVQDISKRKQAEQTLIESQQRLALATQSAHIGIWDWNVVQNILVWDRKMYQLYGVREQDFSGAYDAWRSVVHPDDLERADAAIAGAIKAGRAFHLEFRVVWPNGKVRYIEAHALVERANDGSATRMIGANWDITERKLAEEEQRFSNALLVTQQETSLDGIYVVDKDQKMVSFNRRFVEMWGIPEEVMRTRSDEAAIKAVLDNFEAPDEFLEGVKALYSQKELKLHDELHLKGDRTFDRFSAPMISANGTYYGRVFYFRDITERKRSEESLHGALVATVGAIAATVESRDPYTAGHQRRVADLAAAIAREMELPQKTVEGLHFGALIHDLGKVQVPAELLSKPTRLTKLEFELIKTHPQAGYDIVKEIKFPWPIAEMVHQHHERLDGTGYPQGLKGDAIALEARVLAVADVVEAMASHRPYRPGLGIDVALKEIEDKRGRWFEPAAVDACVRLFREKGYRLQQASA